MCLCRVSDKASQWQGIDIGSGTFLNWCGGDFFRMTVGLRLGCPLSPVLFNIFIEKRWCRRLWHLSQHPLEKNCLADGAIEIDTPLSSVSIGGRSLCNLWFADDLGGSKEELQQLAERIEKTAAAYGVEIATGKGKILVNGIKPRPSTNIWMNGKSARKSEPVQILGIYTNKRWNIIKGSEDQTGASTLSHDKACSTVEKQSHRFSYED